MESLARLCIMYLDLAFGVLMESVQARQRGQREEEAINCQKISLTEPEQIMVNEIH